MAIHANFPIPEETTQRRDKSRREIRLLSEVAVHQGPSGDIRIENISSTGLLLNTPLELETGEMIMVSLPDSGERAAEVVWSSENFHGCRFLEPLDSSTLETIRSRSEILKSALAGAGQNNNSKQAIDSEEGIESFGARLTRLRKARDLNQSQLADAVDVSKTTAWKWENDIVRPRNQALSKLARVLGSSEMELLFGSEAQPVVQDARSECKAGSLQDVIAACKRDIARAAGTNVDNIGITIAM